MIQVRYSTFAGKEQALRKGVPAAAINHRERHTVGCLIRHQGHAVGNIGVKIDAGEQSLRLAVRTIGAVFMALEQEMAAVIVAGVWAFLVFEHKIGVLVGLGLGSLDGVVLALDGIGGGNDRAVAAEAIIFENRGRILERLEALRGGNLHELGRKRRRYHHALR